MKGFTRTRGQRATARCKNVGTYGSPLYCECGCQVPQDSDVYNLIGLSAKVTKSFQVYTALMRDGKIVGAIDKARNYVSLDGNEYLGVIDGSALSTLFSLPVEGDEPEQPMTPGSTLEETVAQVQTAEIIELAEMDERNASHPGYCKKCHSYCYGDCEANI